MSALSGLLAHVRCPLRRLLAPGALAAALALTATASASAAELHVSPFGSDGGSCSSAAPCRSLDRAYREAAPGDVVVVAGGSYGSQTVPALGRSGPAVELRAAEGASVTLSGLAIQADHLVVRGMRVSGWLSVDSKNAADPVEQVTLRDMHSSLHWVNNARDFTWKGGSIGPSHNIKAAMIGGQPASHRITYDGVLFHDATRDNKDVHMECLYAASVQGLTVRNSRFTNCAVFDVLITRMASDAQPRDIVFENNVFERSRDIGTASAYYTFMVHENVTLNSLVLRNNVWELPFALNGPVQSGRVVGNIGVSGWDGGCRAGLRYAHNVFTTKQCGSTDKVSSGAFSQFVNPAGGDWRLKAGATAIDAADPDDAPLTDAAGNGRNGTPDAGAFEYGGTTSSEPEPEPGPGPAPAPGPDTRAPSVPQGMAWTTVTQTSIGLRWDAASDDVGVVGYRIYRDGSLVGTTTQTDHSVSGLACGSSHTIGLTAVDAAGNESNRAEATGTTSTSACGSAPPEPDTRAPSVPQGMTWTTVTQTSIGLRWDAASDDVGVVGYRIYRDGSLVGTTTQTDHSVSGLACGSSHTIGLTAVDAAGNESNRAEATGTASTSACSAPETPTDSTSPTKPRKGGGGKGRDKPSARTAFEAPEEGLVGSWSFDEAAGATVLDGSGEGNVGTIDGARRVRGRHGGALSFDGRGDVVTIPHSASLELDRAMTVEAWVRPRRLGRTWRAVAVKQRSRNLAYGLYAASAKRRPSSHLRRRGDRGLSGPSALKRNRWTHLATTWNGRVLRLLINGRVVARHRLRGSVAESTGALQIGGNALWGEWFKGLIDDVRIYRRALTAAQVRADMRAPAAAATGSPAASVTAATGGRLRRAARGRAHRVRWL